jgi:hypothetical protein
MRTLSFLLWTGCSVALGIWLATVEIGGRTPVQHGQRALRGWGLSVPQLPGMGAAGQGEGKSSLQIRERHTDAERDALNKLVSARRGAAK